MSCAAPAANVAGVGMPDANQVKVPREPPPPAARPGGARRDRIWYVPAIPHEMRRGTVRPGGRRRGGSILGGTQPTPDKSRHLWSHRYPLRWNLSPPTYAPTTPVLPPL